MAHTVACTIPMTADLIANPDCARMLEEMAPVVLGQLAIANGYAIIPGTIRETEREWFVWHDTGQLDDNGDPIRTLAPLHLANDTPADMCQIWYLVDVERINN